MPRYSTALIGLVLSAGVMLGQSPAQRYTPPTAPPAPDAVGVLLRLVGLTLVTLLICGGLIWWARRAGKAKLVAPNTAGRLVLDGQLALDTRGKLILIRVDGQPVVVTTDATGLRSIVPLQERFDAVLSDEINEPVTPKLGKPGVTS
jgi:flagellar biogenesis protein FliO